MTVSEVGRIAMGSANSESPDLVTQATSGAKSAIWSFSLSSAAFGGFQLLDLIITELKSHMTCYNSMPLIGWNYSIQTGEQIL